MDFEITREVFHAEVGASLSEQTVARTTTDVVFVTLLMAQSKTELLVTTLKKSPGVYNPGGRQSTQRERHHACFRVRRSPQTYIAQVFEKKDEQASHRDKRFRTLKSASIAVHHGLHKPRAGVGRAHHIQHL